MFQCSGPATARSTLPVGQSLSSPTCVKPQAGAHISNEQPLCRRVVSIHSIEGIQAYLLYLPYTLGKSQQLCECQSDSESAPILQGAREMPSGSLLPCSQRLEACMIFGMHIKMSATCKSCQSISNLSASLRLGMWHAVPLMSDTHLSCKEHAQNRWQRPTIMQGMHVACNRLYTH